MINVVFNLYLYLIYIILIITYACIYIRFIFCNPCVARDVGIDSDDGKVGTFARDGGCGAR